MVNATLTIQVDLLAVEPQNLEEVKKVRTVRQSSGQNPGLSCFTFGNRIHEGSIYTSLFQVGGPCTFSARVLTVPIPSAAGVGIEIVNVLNLDHQLH